MRLTLGRKLGLGFGVILTLMAFSAIISYIKLSVIKEEQDSAFNLRFPSVEAARKLQRDLNQCGNKGRQAILAGTDPVQRVATRKLSDEAWVEVDKVVAVLDELAPHWTMQENRDRLVEIKKGDRKSTRLN